MKEHGPLHGSTPSSPPVKVSTSSPKRLNEVVVLKEYTYFRNVMKLVMVLCLKSFSKISQEGMKVLDAKVRGDIQLVETAIGHQGKTSTTVPAVMMRGISGVDDLKQSWKESKDFYEMMLPYSPEGINIQTMAILKRVSKFLEEVDVLTLEKSIPMFERLLFKSMKAFVIACVVMDEYTAMRATPKVPMPVITATPIATATSVLTMKSYRELHEADVKVSSGGTMSGGDKLRPGKFDCTSVETLLQEHLDSSKGVADVTGVPVLSEKNDFHEWNKEFVKSTQTCGYARYIELTDGNKRDAMFEAFSVVRS